MRSWVFQIGCRAIALLGGLLCLQEGLKAQGGGVMLLGPLPNSNQPIIIPPARESIFSPTVIVPPPAVGGTEAGTEVITGNGSDAIVSDGTTNQSSITITSPIPADPIVVTNVPSGFLPPDADPRNPVPVEPPPIVVPPIPFGGTPFQPIQPPAVVTPPIPATGTITTPAAVNPPPALPGNQPALPGGQPGLSTGQGIPGPPPGPPPPLTRAPGSRF